MRGMAKVGGLGPSPRPGEAGAPFKTQTIYVPTSGRMRIPEGATQAEFVMVQAGTNGTPDSQGGQGGPGGRSLRKTLRIQPRHKTIAMTVGTGNGQHTSVQVNGEPLWSTANEFTEAGGVGGLAGWQWSGGGNGQAGGSTSDGAGAGGGGASSVQSSVYGGQGGIAYQTVPGGGQTYSERGRGGGGGGNGAASYPGSPGPATGVGGGDGRVPGGGGGGGYNAAAGTSGGPGLGARGEVKIIFR